MSVNLLTCLQEKALQYINLLNQLYKSLIAKLTSNYRKIWRLEILVIITVWSISLIVSSSVFNRPLNIDAHHEYLTAHSLVSLRALDQWGIGRLLGASVLVPKSIEYLQSDITIFNKGDGVYLSYPSLWLVFPYVIFKILAIPISTTNLQIYHLICDRLLSSIVIYFLFLEIIRLFKIPDFVNGWGARLLAFTATSAWMFNPPVLYWTQNVYFCDQAVLLPIYTLILFAVKHHFQFTTLSRFNQLILFALSLLAAGFDWYGWVFLFLLIMTVALPIVFKDIGAALRSILPIVVAITCISIWFLAQLIYYKDGFNQVSNIAVERVGAHLEFNLNQDLFVMTHYWVKYLPKYIQAIWDAGKLYLSVILLILAILLGWLCGHSQSKLNFLSVCLLIFFAPLMQISILRQHSTIHDFSALKLALPTVFTLWIVMPLAILLLIKYLPKLFISVSWSTIVAFLILSFFASKDVSSELLKFAGSGGSYPREIGAIVQKYIVETDLPISDSPKIFIGSVPPQPTWYANRFVYRTPDLPNLIRRSNLSNLKHLNPVFLIYADEKPSPQVQEFCKDSWQSIPETIMDKNVLICRSNKLRDLL